MGVVQKMVVVRGGGAWGGTATPVDLPPSCAKSTRQAQSGCRGDPRPLRDLSNSRPSSHIKHARRTAAGEAGAVADTHSFKNSRPACITSCHPPLA